jgi:hypothetical protein
MANDDNLFAAVQAVAADEQLSGHDIGCVLEVVVVEDREGDVGERDLDGPSPLAVVSDIDFLDARAPGEVVEGR